MSDQFYADFERFHYASEEDIEQYRSIYLPYVNPLLKYFAGPVALDFGCGRGEWLGMMRNLGFETYGVDIDAGMLKSALRKGLNVELGDGMEYLKKVPSASVSVLTAFHVLEHLQFKEIRDFFAESKRILKPGGLLILETPNPENLHVATTNFYLDPTHVRPIPILQMVALAKQYEYETYSIIRLQEDKSLYNKQDVSFKDLYYGVSKDYAIIAQNPGGDPNLISALENPLKYETGIGIDEILKRLDERMNRVSNDGQSNNTVIL